jgi:alpha-L-arabinofuranosidase
VASIQRYDPTRLVNEASGWHNRESGDVRDVHSYPGPGTAPLEEDRAVVLGNRVSIDPLRVIAPIDPNVFGGFAEHLGRCIYGGIYEPGSPLADADGIRTDVLAALKRLRMPVMRYPGGNFVSGYRWRDAVGPKEERAARMELAWHDLEPNTFGTNEFVDFCRKLGSEPYLAVNAGDGDMREARDWVEYANGTKDTALVKLRKRHGYEAPHGVRYWGIGNEVDGPWQIGYKTPEEYARTYTEFAKVMKWNAFFRHARSVKMANIAQIVNVIAPIMTRPDGLVLQTTFHPFELYARTAGDTALDVHWSGDTFSTPEFSALRVLDVAATLDAGRKQLAVYLVNRSEQQPAETTILLQRGRFAGPGVRYVINGPDVKATNTFDAPDSVGVRESALAADGDTLQLTLEPHSVNAVVLDIA